MCRSLSWVNCENSFILNIWLNSLLFWNRNTSGILSSYQFRQQDHKPLPHLNSIVYNSHNSPVFIVSDRPTIYFIGSLMRFYNNTKYTNNGAWMNDGIRQYIENFAENTKFNFSLNWFLRQEILFVMDLLKSSSTHEVLDKSVLLRVAYKVLVCLTETQINDVLHIFSQFIFNIDMYPQTTNLSSDTMNRLKSTYGRICAEFYLNTASAQVISNEIIYDWFETNRLYSDVGKRGKFRSNSNAIERLAGNATLEAISNAE